MARARNGNQRGTPTGPFGKRRDRMLKTAGRPTPRTGGGMKLPKKKVMRGPTGGDMKLPTKKVMRGPTGGDMKVPTRKRRPRVSDTGFGLRRPRRPVPRPRRR